MTAVAGRYRILDRLGHGGMSVVWRAHDEVLDRDVAIKVLNAPDQQVNGAVPVQVRAEARAAAAVCHPNLAAVHDFGESPDAVGTLVPYVVMELVNGPTLAQVLADGPVAPAEAVRICADVAAGLAAVHAHGLVHRDVKPANVIVTADGAKLVDFGIAATIGELDVADENGIMLGTPAYVAPERLDDGPVVPGSDVYALGLLLYRLLSGVLPWSVETTTEMLTAHAYLPPRRLPSIDGVSDDVIDLCHRCLEKDPDDRPSAADVAAALTQPAHAARLALDPAAAARSMPQDHPDDPDRLPGAAAIGGRAAPARRLAWLLAVVAGLVVAAILAGPHVFGPASGRPDPGEQQAGVPPVPSLDPSSLPAGGGTPGVPATTPGAAAGSAGPDGAAGGTGAAPTAGPGGGSPQPGGTTAPGQPEPTNPVRRTVETAGGSAVVECSGTIARLTAATPADGYQTQAVQAGPGPTVHVKFRAGNTVVSVQAGCRDGVPDVTIR